MLRLGVSSRLLSRSVDWLVSRLHTRASTFDDFRSLTCGQINLQRMTKSRMIDKLDSKLIAAGVSLDNASRDFITF